MLLRQRQFMHGIFKKALSILSEDAIFLYVTGLHLTITINLVCLESFKLSFSCCNNPLPDDFRFFSHIVTRQVFVWNSRTSICMSIRSSKGPDTFLRYLCICLAYTSNYARISQHSTKTRVHGTYEHEGGRVRYGSNSLETVTSPFSSGWRNTSRTFL